MESGSSFINIPIELLVIILNKVSQYHQGLMNPYKYVCRTWKAVISTIPNNNLPTSISCFIRQDYIRPEMILWLREQQCPESHVCLTITKLNNLELLKWAVSEKFIVNRSIYLLAARLGYVDILEYSKSIGQYITYTIFRRPVEFGHTHVLEWLYKNYPAMTVSESSMIYEYALQSNNLEVLEWAILHDCRISLHFGERMIRYCDLYKLQWFCQLVSFKNAPGLWECMLWSSKIYNRSELRRWLKMVKCPNRLEKYLPLPLVRPDLLPNYDG